MPLSNSSMGLFEDAVSFFDWFLRGCAATPPKNGLTVKFDSLKMTHAFSRSVLHVVSRNAQCPSKKNQFLLLARIDAKNAIICVGLQEKLQGPYRYVTSRNPGKPSRKNCQLGRALEEYVYFKLKYEIGSNYILSFC